jgi:hypothetical protein
LPQKRVPLHRRLVPVHRPRTGHGLDMAFRRRLLERKTHSFLIVKSKWRV